MTAPARLPDGPASSHIRRELEDGVLTLTFTRDAKLNAVSPSMLAALRAAVWELGDSDGARVLVVTAEGRHFTAGMDITAIDPDLGISPDGAVDGTRVRRNYRDLHLLLDEVEAVEKPVVLAAQGPCRGFGLELAVSCDFRFASDRATFSLPEVANLALLPGSGGISRLTRLVGPHWASWIGVAGRTVDASQALGIGLVHEVHPPAELSGAVQAFARSLVGLPQQVLGLGKLAVATAASVDRGTARDFDRVANTLLMTSPEHRDRVRAFGRPS